MTHPILSDPQSNQETDMFRTTYLALAAVAAIGAALATSTSSAEAGGHGGGFRHGGGYHHAQHHRPHWQHHHHRHHHHGYRPYAYGVGTAAVAAPAYAAVAPKPAAGPCTCLTKEYTADKLVVFKDLCTKEAAAAPLGGAPQAAAQPQRAPQPGSVEPEDEAAATK
jgi:hypothetical protein